MNIKHIFNICLFFHTSILFAAQTIALAPEAGTRSRAHSHHSFEDVRAWQEAQRTETRTSALADTVAHAGTFSPHTPAYAISSPGDWTFGDPEQVAQRERERIARLPEHRIALYKKIRPTIAALQALSYQEMQRVACKPAKSLHIKSEILALNHFVHQNEDVLSDFVDETQPLAPSTLAFPRIENLEALKNIALTYQKRRVVVLLMPQAEKQEKKEESAVAFIQCREAAASEIAEFDKDGKLRLSRVHFQKCYESSDGKLDLIKSKQNSLPGVDFSVFGDYPLQMSITYGVGSSVPIVREVIVIVGTAYVVIKEIKDWLHYYRKIRNIQKLEKQIQQDKERAAKNSASPEPEDPKDKDERFKRESGKEANNKEARKVGEDLGFKEEKNPPFKSKGQLVFRKGNKYISRDIDSHKGGYWKVIVKEGGRQIRSTFSKDLKTRIGD